MMGGWCKGDLEPITMKPVSDTRITVSDSSRLEFQSTHLTWTHANGTRDQPIGVLPGYDWDDLMDPWQEITRMRRCLGV